MKRKQLIFWVAGAVVVIILGLILFFSMNQQSQYTGEDISKSGTVTIGVAGSADVLKTNTLFWKGIELAVNEINQKGGIKGKGGCGFPG